LTADETANLAVSRRVSFPMYAALDVQYDDPKQQALAAGVVFSDWSEARPAAEYTALCRDVAPYIPGEFYRRELPCLLAVLREIKEPIECILIDGYVQLGDKPGLGQHLSAELNEQAPIIGVAKTPYAGAVAVEVIRGASRSPLFVTSIGIDVTTAARHVQQMAGVYRVPDLLRRVDQLARGLPTAPKT
jgi:deoxyribonuclease V